MLSGAVEPILCLRRQMRSKLAMMTKKVRCLALPDATCRLLMTLPGVGPVRATDFVAAVDDPARSTESTQLDMATCYLPDFRACHWPARKPVSRPISWPSAALVSRVGPYRMI